ncbi:hypothetical protein NQU47_09710 [Pseudoalteromonas distincta]|uniref:hypothetical protein n=1 Tax=Pseudoalteromonas distincta TaxID=77608 RepID=UPI0011F0A679|nr:hypothetical protein [Pseudoalteromonas distincta]KAA1158957.1 hypothetical protein EU511_11145 [Pseudoalteromonas distincta]MDC3212846.1 hypothetical protein [Pseudoalteromonas distincta]
MKILAASIPYQVHSSNTQPLAQSDKLTVEKASEEKSEEENEEEPKYVLSKFLDTKAEEYSEDNATFGNQYKNLEKVYKHFTGRVIALQEQINKLKQSPVQRSLTINTSASELNKSDASLTLDAEHLGAKKYKNTQQQEQIDMLELQLGELKSEQAAIKQQMVELVISELKRRGDDYTI